MSLLQIASYSAKLAYNVAPSLLDFVSIGTLAVPGLAFKWVKNIHVKGLDTLVVLIHGSGVSSFQWGLAQIYLWSKGIEHHCVDYDSSRPIMESIEDVKRQIMAAYNPARHRDVALVGHSQGGLIARYLYNDRDTNMDNITNVYISQVYTLNAPQQGAKIATTRNILYNFLGWSSSDASRDMEPDSDFIKLYTSICDDKRAFVVSGKFDFVSKESALWKQGDKDKRYTGWSGHYASAVNPFLWYNFIIKNIKNLSHQ